MCLLTSPSFFSLPTFALETEGSPANSPKVTVGSPKQIDQSIYGNLLENPTLQVENNTIPNWSVATTADGSATSYYIVNNTPLHFSDGKYFVGNTQSYIQEDGQTLILRGYGAGKDLTVSSNPITLMKNRSYEFGFNIEYGNPSNYNYGWLLLRSNGYRLMKNVISNYAIATFPTGKISATYKPTVDNQSVNMEFGSATSYTLISKNSIHFNLKYADQWKAVDGLFTSLDHSTLAPGVSTPQINQVKTLVTTTSYHDDRADMLKAIDRATQLLTKRDQELQQTILTQLEQLLINGELAPNVTLE
ncbi:toxin Cry1Ac domain D-VI-related protein, partial [Enterococcus hirae]